MSLPSMKLNYESLHSPLLYICDGKLWGFDCRFQSNQCKCMIFSSVGKRVTAYDVQKLIDHGVNFCWIYIPNCKCPQIAKTNLFFCQKQQGKMIAVKKWIKCDFEVQNKQACTQVLSKLHAHVSGLRFLKCFFSFSCINTSMKEQAVLRPFHKQESFWIYFRLPDVDISYVWFVSILAVIEKRLICAACLSWGLLNYCLAGNNSTKKKMKYTSNKERLYKWTFFLYECYNFNDFLRQIQFSL